MKRIIFLLLITAAIIFLPLASVPHAQTNVTSNPMTSPTSQHVTVYSTDAGSNDILYIPVNSTGTQAYPDWHLFLYGSGSFNFIVNGSTVESGVSLGVFNFTYSWHTQNSYANATLDFGSAVYSFHAILTGILTNQVISSVTISTSYPGQDQFLTAASGTSGALLYPHWMVTMQSTQNVTYTINVNGQTIFSGHMIGTHVIDFNVSGSTASVIIGLGTHVYSFLHEIVATVPIQKYYAPTPPPLVGTESDIIFAVGAGAIAVTIWMLIGAFTLRPFVMDRMKRRPRSR